MEDLQARGTIAPDKAARLDLEVRLQFIYTSISCILFASSRIVDSAHSDS